MSENNIYYEIITVGMNTWTKLIKKAIHNSQKAHPYYQNVIEKMEITMDSIDELVSDEIHELP